MSSNPVIADAIQKKETKINGEYNDQPEPVSGQSVTGKREYQTDRLLEVASSLDLFHTPDGTGYADAPSDGHRATFPIRSGSCRKWLTRVYLARYDRAPSSNALQTVIDTLDAHAESGPERVVSLRVGELDGRIFLDLGRPDWSFVEVSGEGWEVVKDPPVRFRRPSAMRPLPLPTRGGTVSDLRDLLSVRNDNDFILLVSWILAALGPRRPVPALILVGPPGAAKSSTATLIRSLVDPNSVALRRPPKDEGDLFVAAQNSHIIAFDNLSGIDARASDALCCLVTGAGFGKRKLYTDGEETILEAQRPVILTGIESPAVRSDLADRSIVIELAPIPEDRRKTEAEIAALAEAARPGILGALLMGVSYGLRNLPSIRLAGLPRMADFAKWSTACETAFCNQGAFGVAYHENRSESIENVLAADPVAVAMRDLMASRPEWSGTASDLLNAISPPLGELRPRALPKSPRSLSERIKRLQVFLAADGIRITYERTGKIRTRTMRIDRLQEDRARNLSSASSAASATKSNPLEFKDMPNPQERTQRRTQTWSADDDPFLFRALMPTADAKGAV